MLDLAGFKSITLHCVNPEVESQALNSGAETVVLRPGLEIQIASGRVYDDPDHFVHWRPQISDLLIWGAGASLHLLQPLLGLTRRLVISAVALASDRLNLVAMDADWHYYQLQHPPPPPLLRLEIYTRFDRYFEEVYQCLRGWLASLGIPHIFKGTYYPRDGQPALEYEDQVAYLFLSAPEVPAPRYNPRALTMLWYFEQPTANYWNQDSARGWFSQVEMLFCPWPAMARLWRERLPWQRVEWLPYRYDPGLIRLPGPPPVRDIDVFFAGVINPNRRQIQEALEQRGLKVVFVSSVFGLELDRLIARSKVSLNIHYYPGAYLEVHRINRLLAYGCRVVSEPSDDPELDAEYADYVDLLPLSQMVDRVVELVANWTPGPDFSLSPPLNGALEEQLGWLRKI